MDLLKTVLILAYLVTIAVASRRDPFGDRFNRVDRDLSLRLSNGSPIRGHYMSSFSGRSIRAFPNIPFAEPPVGQLRLADPVPKAAWTTEMILNNDSRVCPQYEAFFHGGARMGQEDCLYLNVYVPKVITRFNIF